MKNKMVDLNNHLFAQLERLGNEDLTAEQLAVEVKRADAIVAVSDQLVRSAAVSLQAARLAGEYGETPSAVRGRASFALLDGKAEIEGKVQ